MNFKAVLALILSSTLLSSAFAGPQAGPGKGQGLYEQPGANSCMYCHGLGGHDGKIAVAANLTKPKTWRTYRGLGGDAAFAKNKTEFVAHLTEALVSLIKNGATVHNSAFKAAWFDKNAAGGNYNAQMIGLTGSPSQNWLKKYQDKGMDKDIAAKSVLMHIKTLDTQGVFAN